MKLFLMNKLENLIQKLCPNGVEYKKLGEVCEYIRGVTYKKKQELDVYTDNSWRVLRANNINFYNNLNLNNIKFISEDVKVRENQILTNGDILICSASGSKSHIGKVAFIDRNLPKYTFGGFMGVVRTTFLVNNRFLFHLLTSDLFKNYLDLKLNTSTINNLSVEIMNKFKIPIPPLEIQEEIVRILDSFTELKSELENELEKRRKQYEFYRDSLLTFGDDVEWKELGEVCSLVMGVSPKGNTISNNKCNLSMEFHQGKKFFGSSNLLESNIYTTNFIKIADVGSLIMSVRAPVGEVNITDRIVCIGRGLCSIKGKDGLITKFIYYFIDSYKDELKNKSKGSVFESINSEDIKKIKIPIPPLSEQERIVSILDKFEELCNDISIGLPAEIEGRRKQYEYYREKLLSFKNISENN